MRLIPIRLLKPNEILSTAIRTQDGRVLLPAKTKITSKYIKRLIEFGIFSVYIEDELFDDVVVSPVLDDETKIFALKALSKLFEAMDKNNPINEDEIKVTGKKIHENVLRFIGLPINLFNLYAVKDQRCLHAINVATVTAAIAMGLNMNNQMISDYILGALLHDIKLSSQKERETPGHAEEGYEFLKSQRGFSARTYMSVYMHHEYFDGSGGPKKISGKNINEGARVILAADIYDKLINGYGIKKLDIHHAVEYINSLSKKILDPDVLQVFNNVIAVYPTGSTVLLNNGYRAIVTNQNINMPTRPVVRLCMKNREDCIEFNLLNERTLFIDKVEA